MNHLIRIVTRPRSWTPDRLPAPAAAGEWAYLGGDASTLAALRAIVPASVVEVNAGEVLDEVLRDDRPDLINLDRAFDDDPQDLTWQAGELAYHCTLLDRLRELCACVVFDRLLDRRTGPGPLWVFVDAWWHGEVLRQRAVSRGTGVVIDDGHARWLPAPLARWGRGAGRLVRLLRTRAAFIRRWRTLRRAASNLPEGSAIGRGVRDLDLLVCCWSTNSELPSVDPDRRNRHWGELLPWLVSQRMRVGLLIQDLDGAGPPVDQVRRARERTTPTLFTFECLSWGDVVQMTIASAVGPWRRRPRARIGDTDVSEALRQALREDAAGDSYAWAWQHVYVAKYLSARGVRVGQILHLHEGQAWERTLRVGLRRHLPQVRIVGYEHNPSSVSYLRVFPSRREIVSGFTPDLLVTCGSASRELFLAAGMDPTRVIAGPALRYADIHAVAGPTDDAGGDVVLVAPGITRLESVEMIGVTLLALADHPALRVVLRPHPLAGDWAAVLAAGLAFAGRAVLPDNVELSHRSLSADLRAAAAVIYRASTVGLEAAVRGIPVIHLASSVTFGVDRLDGHPIPRTSVRTPGDVLHAAEAAVRARGRISAVDAGALFGRVDPSSLSVFLPGHPVPTASPAPPSILAAEDC